MALSYTTSPRFTLPAAAPAAVTLLALALLALLLVRLSLREDYWLDESCTIRRIAASWGQVYSPASVVPAEPVDPFDGRDIYDLNPPFYFAAVRLIAGPAPGRLTVRLFSIVPMLLALAALAAWARAALGARGGLALVLIGATAPGIIFYAHDARPYAFPLALAALLVWLGARWWGRPRRLFFACALGAAAGCLCHFSFAWWTIAQWLVFTLLYLQARQDGRRADLNAAGAGMLGLMTGAVLAVCAILPQWSILRQCKDAPSTILRSDVLMNTVGLPYSGVDFGVAPVPAALCFILQAATLALLAGLLRRSPRRQTGLLAMLLWLVPTVLPIINKYWFNMPFFERYTFFSLAGWLMMVAWIAQESAERRGWTRRAIVLLLLALLGSNLAWGARNLTHPLREEWGRVVRVLQRDSRPGEGYSLDPVFLRMVFAVNARTPPPARFIDQRAGVPAGVRTLWLVLDGRVHRHGLAAGDWQGWNPQLILAVHGLYLYRLDRP